MAETKQQAAKQQQQPPMSPPHQKGSVKPTKQQDAVEDRLFDMFREKPTDTTISVGKFIQALQETGLRKSDPRLKVLMTKLKKLEQDKESYHGLHLTREEFTECVRENIVLVSMALQREFVIPEFQALCTELTKIYEEIALNNEGKPADYIPQLARFDPKKWAVSVCTVDGQRFSVGDCNDMYCLQSTSKTFNYVIALEDNGPEVFHKYVGQEPSGRIFNELCLDNLKRPHNPFINAGAICTVSLIANDKPISDRFEYVMNKYRALAGNEYVGFNNPTFLSERATADRNFALGYFMKEHKCFPPNSDLYETLDLYFQLCSCEVTNESAAVMAATLANGGICPTTGEKVMRSESVRDVLSLMFTCGMYDYSGQFSFHVGLPAKSGVSGVILIVVPNVCGFALWSPPLDRYGNSVRGVEFCKQLVRTFNFHNFDNVRHTAKKRDPRGHTTETQGLQVVTLLFSAANADMGSLRRLFLSGADMGAADYDGRTALHQAASEGHLHVVRFLLETCKVKHDPHDRWNRTPLNDAEQFGHEAVAQYLLDYVSKANAHQLAG